MHRREDRCRARLHDGNLLGLLLFELTRLLVEHVLRLDRGKLGFELGDIGPEAAILRYDLLTVLGVHTDNAVTDDRSIDQLSGLLGRQFVGRQFLRDVDPTRGLRALARRLEIRPVLADAQGDIVRDPDRVDLARVDLTHVVDDRAQAAVLFAAEVEPGEPLDTVGFAAGDAVEVVFHAGSEVVLHQVGKILLEQPHDGERDPVRHERLPARRDIAAVDDRGDDGCVGRRTTDTQLFQRFDEAGLRVARRCRGLMALGLHLDERQRLPLCQWREFGLGGIGRRVAHLITALLVRVHEAAEGDDRARGDELGDGS